jgi:dihydrofolate reductase
MTATSSREFIAAMQVTLDGYILGPEGESDWVDSWADGLGLLPEVDAFVLGGGMFPDYEQFWTTILDDPATAPEWLGRAAYDREIEYALVAATTPHLVLSTTLNDASWPTARLVRDLDALRAFKARAGNPVYVVGGPGLVTRLINAELLDELRLIVHPVAVGAGRSVFGEIHRRQELHLLRAEPTRSGRMILAYQLAGEGQAPPGLPPLRAGWAGGPSPPFAFTMGGWRAWRTSTRCSRVMWRSRSNVSTGCT